MPRITVESTKLVTQAPTTAEFYFDRAVRKIDKKFGDDYAKNHPELIAAFMQACGQDFTMAILVSAIEEASESISTAIGTLVDIVGCSE